MAEQDLSGIAALLAAAHQMVTDLCKRQGEPGWRRWEMSIPARPDHDPDLVIGAALYAADQLVTECVRLRESVVALQDEVATLRAQLAEAEAAIATERQTASTAVEAAAVATTALGVLAGEPASDFMESFGPIQLAMEARAIIKTAHQLASDNHTVEMSGYHDNYTDAARARSRIASNLVLLRAMTENFNRSAMRQADTASEGDTK